MSSKHHDANQGADYFRQEDRAIPEVQSGAYPTVDLGTAYGHPPDLPERGSGSHELREVSPDDQASRLVIFLEPVGNLPIPAPRTSSAIVRYTSPTVPVILV